MQPVPDDLFIRYDWHEGTIPPPYHYEYTISIGADGRGQVEMMPGYSSSAAPVWTEGFSVSPEALAGLYRLMGKRRLLATRWREIERPPVGGSTNWLSVTAGGRQVCTPAFIVPAQQPAAEAVYAAIKALVPQEIWDRLHEQREQYVRDNES